MSPRPNVEERRRTEVLTAACELIAARGYAAVRIADVAERAGISTGTVHYYFADKRTMLEAALTFAVEASIARRGPQLAGLEDPEEQLRRLVELYLPVGPEALTWRVYVQFWGEALTKADLRADNALLYGRWRDFVAGIVRAGQAAGRLAPGDPDDLAAGLVALLDGLAIQAILDPEAMPIERMRRLLREHVGDRLIGRDRAPARTR